ncbi:UNVERIFIED_CONTAM: hypothetical protein Slati_3698200 [Sesamum latifolium]|uniref:Uncharacterized protein n=1 Tax=Sesamum latifolium TaxID=2727402 RepID=A0AAW2U194_9LAMI
MKGMMANFFWHGGGQDKVHLITWDYLCNRMKEGGLGFRRMREYNIAMLANISWRVVIQPDSILHQVLRMRDLLIAGTCWKVPDGISISIIGVPWLPQPHTFQPIYTPRSLSGNTKVADLMAGILTQPAKSPIGSSAGRIKPTSSTDKSPSVGKKGPQAYLLLY